MIDPTIIDDLSRTIGKLMPPGLADVKDDVERNARAAVQSALGRLDLVTREEFEVQSQVLQRTRMRLQALEERVAALDGQAAGDPTRGSDDPAAPADPDSGPRD